MGGVRSLSAANATLKHAIIIELEISVFRDRRGLLQITSDTFPASSFVFTSDKYCLNIISRIYFLFNGINKVSCSANLPIASGIVQCAMRQISIASWRVGSVQAHVWFVIDIQGDFGISSRAHLSYCTG
jgi:hypothetical protein